MRSGASGWGAGLPVPLGQPRVPKGGGAEPLRSRPAGFSRGLTPAHWELQEFARLRLQTLQMADQGVCERRPAESSDGALGCSQAPIRPDAGPTVQGKKQLPSFSVPFRSSCLKPLLPTPFLPAVNLEAKPQF